MSTESNLSAFTAQGTLQNYVELCNDAAERGSNKLTANKPLHFSVGSFFAGIIWSWNSGQKFCRSGCVDSLGAERDSVAFRNTDEQQPRELSCAHPPLAVFCTFVGTDYQGDARAGGSRRAGKPEAGRGPCGNKAGSHSQGPSHHQPRSGAAPTLGTRHLTW